MIASLTGGTAASFGLWFGYQHWQFVFWLLSLVLLVPAFAPRAVESASPPAPWTWTEIAVLALIVLLGAFFRLYRLDTVPPGLWVDEISAAQRAEGLILHKPFLPFDCTPLTWRANWVQTSNLYLYSIVVLFKLVGFGYWPIKMISVVPGILGVPALYLFARELAGKRTAVVAGVLFAVGHWNARLSRWGWDEVAMTTLQIVSFYFLVRGFRRSERRSFVWAGIFMGLCLNTYIASRLSLAAALACLGLYVVSRWDGWLERAKPLGIFALATTLTVAPLAIFYLQHPQFFNVRTGEVSLLGRALADNDFQPVVKNIVAHLKMFHVRGDIFAKHNLPYSPMLDPVTGGLFVVGLAMSLWRWRSPGFLLCQCWLWFGLLAGMLSDNFGHPHAYRTGNVAPAAIVMAALPLGWLLDRYAAARQEGVVRGRLAVAFASIAVVTAVAMNADNLLVRWMRLPDLWGETMGSPGTTLARHIVRQATDNPVFVSRGVTDGGFGALMGSGLNEDRLRFGNWNPDYWNPDTNPPLSDIESDVTFYCSPSWELWMRSWYPNTKWSELRNQYGDVYCATADIPLGDIQATHGFRRTVVSEARDDVADMPFASRVLEGLEGSWTLFAGYVHERGPGYVAFAVPAGFQGALWLDGRRILETGEQVSSEEKLTFGMHSLSIVVPGAVEEPPRLARRNLWMRGVEIPIENLSSSGEGALPGLRATVYAGTEWKGEPVGVVEGKLPAVLADHPAPPYSVLWEGYLRADATGDYFIGAAMDDGGSVAVDGREIFQTGVGFTDGAVRLAAGWHRIEVRYYDTGEGAYLALRWVPPGHRESVAETQWAAHQFVPLAADDVYQLPFAGSGLRARYYANTKFEGDPFLSVVESGPWLSNHQGEHFSVELDGYWYFPYAGRFWLGVDSDDGSWLYLDDELIVDNGGVHGFAPKGREVDVARGLHRVRVRYFQEVGGAGLKLLWAEAGKERYAVLPVFLYPEES